MRITGTGVPSSAATTLLRGDVVDVGQAFGETCKQ